MMPQNLLKGRNYQDTIVDLDVKHGKLIIKNLETADNDIVEYFKKQKDGLRQERFVSALRTGVIALKSGQTSENVDFVKKEFENLKHKFVVTLDTTIQDIANSVEEHFGENGIIVKDIFDPNREGSPLNQLRNEMRNELSGLRQDLGIKEAEDEIKNKTTLKGADFEEICYEILGKAAKINGDLLEDTTGVTGKLKACKKGDYVLTLSDCKKKITFDAKDVGSISATKIKEVLEGAIENREASYAILVVKSPDAVPKSIGAFNEIGDNMLVCAIGNGDEVTIHDELLLMALRYAKIRVLSQSANNKHVDASFIQEKIGNIRQKIGKLRSSKADCTNIEKSTKNIRNNLESIEDEINEDLDSLDKSLDIKK